MKQLMPPALLVIVIFLHACSSQPSDVPDKFPTPDDGHWLILAPEDLQAGIHHTRHAEIFGKYISGYNKYILQSIDQVQATAPDGGGYFTGITAQPPESPVGYALSLFGKPLLEPPRPTSYCSGATYSVLIESLNRILQSSADSLPAGHYEALRMQEPDGGRREDGVKFWGKWNDDGFGNHFALVQYAGMGREIAPPGARPGDFMNISWKHGGGHSTVFLGWAVNELGEKSVAYWSSQTRTNGFGDEVVDLARISAVKIVRLVRPERVFHFDIAKQVDRSIPGDTIVLPDGS